MAPRFAVRRLEEVPTIDAGDGPQWFPLQHYFGLTAFGANVYVAADEDEELISEHAEAGSRQEELYVVTAGEATFVIEGERFEAPAVTVVAVPDPSVRRAATARSVGTTIVAVGGERQQSFHSSWQPHHFEHAPRLEG